MSMMDDLGPEIIEDDDDSYNSEDHEDTSSSFETNEKGSTHSSSKDGDAPEALVRNENRAVHVVRLVVIFILITAASLTSFFVYKFTADSQEESFEDAFDTVAAKLTSGLVSDTSLKFWMARTLSDATAMMPKATDSTVLSLFIPQDDWENISREARFHGNVNMASWNPLLKTDQDRKTFEAFAQTQTFTVGAEPQCFVCETEERGFSNPEDLVELPGFGKFTCATVESSGRQGVIPEENCQLITEIATVRCMCHDLPPGTQILDNQVAIPEQLFKVDEIQGPLNEPYGNAPYLPIWTSSVLEVAQLPIMYNQMSDLYRRRAIDAMLESTLPVMSETIYRTGTYYSDYGAYENETCTILQFPVLVDGVIAGSISFDMRWSTFLSFVFPPLAEFVDIVIENSCGQNFTYTVDPEADSMVLKGEGDLHEAEFLDKVYSSTFEDFESVVLQASTTIPLEGSDENYCRYKYHIYATQTLRDEYVSKEPVIFAMIIATVFVFTSLVFVLYDFVVGQRQRKVMASATRSNAIVSSLFPKNVRDRLFVQAAEDQEASNLASSSGMRVSKLQMQTFLAEGKESALTSEPIADLFASATVMFLDIAGFTAWSSEREPSQVFQLLESVYQKFDEIARRLEVFKVETIGDSYVAVCGLPKRRDGHAQVMVRFADKCLKAMARVTRNLEVHLGPSTGDLQARVGLHSGPVTAGVLRGEKARFQLFGDTVNTASRIESTGEPGRIQASKDTVDLLIAAGRTDWVQIRKDLVAIKGKGDWQTYFVTPFNQASEAAVLPSVSDEQTLHESEQSSTIIGNGPITGPTLSNHGLSTKTNVVSRLVDWNVEVLYLHLERMVTNRESSGYRSTPREMVNSEVALLDRNDGKIVIDEMTEILALPAFCLKVDSSMGASVDPKVKIQLRQFVTRISRLYRNVPFHNFEHVSHVLMSASKLMKRIINPEDIDYKQNDDKVAIDVHQSTYGISSDPILQFAVVFSALIHDVDHSGLTNAELVTLETPEALAYLHKSVAEQNSVDLAWGILMESKFKELRACIYTDEAELQHFRKLIVNAVMATDIADKGLKEYRENRWETAFREINLDDSVKPCLETANDQLDRDRKATIVFEYIIQASDVCHTMQHWHTYQKFNKRLFEERYLAWLNGHLGKEPSVGWYGGELWFFDNYIIPLAKKLHKCGVFGVSYHEYLTYAMENRKEWERKGKDIVTEMKAHCDQKYVKKLGFKTNKLKGQSQRG